MATTSTLKQILDQLARESGYGFILPVVTGTTTTLTSLTSYLAGPFTGSKIPIGTPVIITSAVGAGDKSYVSDYVPSTGVLTVSPAITTSSTSAIIYPEGEIKHPDVITDAIDRAFNNHIVRWQLTPLTFVPDGDLRGATVTNYWTAAANGTAAYATAQIYPAVSAVDEVGPVGLNRVLQLTSTGATSVVGNGIRTQHTANNRLWYFKTSIRLVSGTGTATFSIYDNTNSADITPSTVMHGNDTLTMTTTTFGDFMVCEGTFQQPATCDEVAPKLTLSATTMVAQMTPVIMFPLGAMTFPIPNRIISDEYIGNFHYATARSQPSGLESDSISEPITTGGRTHTIQDYGDHYSVTFNFMPKRAVYFDELTYDTALGTTMSSTTTFPLDYVVKWAKFELLNYLWQSEKEQFSPSTGRAMPSKYLTRRNTALKAAMHSEYEPGMMQIYGRAS